MMFHESNPGIIYARVNNTQIWKYTSTDWSSYSQTEIADFANPLPNQPPCLPQGSPQVNVAGLWGTAVPTSMNIGSYHTWGSVLSFGLQDQGYWAAAYKEGINGTGDRDLSQLGRERGYRHLGGPS